MGKGTNSNSNVLPKFTWDEISQHKGPTDRWIVISDHVYDITRWQNRHPGGAKIIGHFAGQDATEAWKAMHKDHMAVSKYLKPMLVGHVTGQRWPPEKAVPDSALSQCKDDVFQYRKSHCGAKTVVALQEDFEALRLRVEADGLFNMNPVFYGLHLLHIVAFELLACLLLHQMGISAFTLVATSVLLATAQAQAGWTQHDYGHRSVFKSRALNKAAHYLVIGFLKGVSAHWWNFRHFQHHVKTNVFKKDPDVSLPYVFLLGDKLPKEWGSKKRGFMPYQAQHGYFWLLGPCLLLPVYFHLEVMYFIIKRREWFDFSMMLTFFARFYLLFGGLLTFWQAFGVYMLGRVFESFWFTFVTQMNHIPMEVDRDQEYDWVTSQTLTTCNVAPGWFNDWFTGHLNFQIEHHLFPMMPRHNYYKVAPLVQALCKKHQLPYVVKPLLTACADILRSLKSSGELWYEAYHDH